jgi:hypothetical protein
MTFLASQLCLLSDAGGDSGFQRILIKPEGDFSVISRKPDQLGGRAFDGNSDGLPQSSKPSREIKRRLVKKIRSTEDTTEATTTKSLKLSTQKSSKAPKALKDNGKSFKASTTKSSQTSKTTTKHPKKPKALKDSNSTHHEIILKDSKIKNSKHRVKRDIDDDDSEEGLENEDPENNLRGDESVEDLSEKKDRSEEEIEKNEIKTAKSHRMGPRNQKADPEGPKVKQHRVGHRFD